MSTKNIKDTIETEISKTAKIIAEYKEMTQPIAPDNSIGRLSRMDAINNKSVLESALRQAEEKLSKLKYALSKVNDSNFGLCMRCKAQIPIGRILLKPESMLCVNCAK